MSFIKEEQLLQLDKLADIYEHVRGISQKVSEMLDDPLPKQLEKSVPGYVSILATHTSALKCREWSVVITGESFQNLVFLARLLLKEHGCDVLCEDKDWSLPVVLCYGDRRYAEVWHEDSSKPPVIIENWDGITHYVRDTRNDQSITSAKLNVQAIALFLPEPLLKKGLKLTLLPTSARGSSKLLLPVDELHSLVSICRQDKHGRLLPAQVYSFIRDLQERNSIEQQFVNASSHVMVCDVDGQPRTDEDFEEAASVESLPFVKDTAVIEIPVTELDRLPECERTLYSDRLQEAVIQALTLNIDNRLQYYYSWLHSFVRRVLHHLRSFLSQCEKSHEERVQTYNEIHNRLKQLTHKADEFFKLLKKEVDIKVNEGLFLLRTHLSNDDVIKRLSTWSESEVPKERIWHEVDAEMRCQISQRIRLELIRWEKESQFFKGVKPYLIQHFQRTFSGLESQLLTLETMIARNDSTDVTDPDQQDWKYYQVWGILPHNIKLNWGQKIMLGLAAPLLLPLALTVAVIGLPLLGGLAAKELILEKLSENKVREFNANKLEYMKRRTKEELKNFIRSKDLENFIKAELQPAYKCIEELQETVPRQINADDAQIESLRDDERDSHDITRFYQPLMEIYQHDKQLLTVYRVLYMRRAVFDVDYDTIEVPDIQHIICDDLNGTIQSVYSCKKGDKTKMALKSIRQKLDVHNIDDYQTEENAYRFQANPNIAKFVGTTKLSGEVFLLMEHLQCNLRQLIGQSPNVTEAAADERTKFDYLKTKTTQVVRGLDYLHDRGCVHFDLSLDSIGIDSKGIVKLTNISCRKLFRVRRDIAKGEIYRYTHLPEEVLVDPPAAYTAVSEMYSVGIMMWEMWTGERAYWEELGDSELRLDKLDKFVTYIETHRPQTRMFYTDEQPTSEHAQLWLNYAQRCWCDVDRLNSKLLLNLIDDEAATLSISEDHFTNH